MVPLLPGRRRSFIAGRVPWWWKRPPGPSAVAPVPATTLPLPVPAAQRSSQCVEDLEASGVSNSAEAALEELVLLDPAEASEGGPNALELCSVCLEALCTEAVTPLLVEGDGVRLQRASCRHYCHFRCALRLQPRRCPVCRQGFSQLRRVTPSGVLEDMTAAELKAAVTRLHGGAPSAAATSAAAAELLAALVPVPALSVRQCLDRITRGLRESGSTLEDASKGDAVSEALAQVLCHLDRLAQRQCRRPRMLSFYAGRQSTSAAARRLRRRLHWCCLRLCSLAGGLSAGLLCGLAEGLLLWAFMRSPPREVRAKRGEEGLLHHVHMRCLRILGPSESYPQWPPWQYASSLFFAVVMATIICFLLVQIWRVWLFVWTRFHRLCWLSAAAALSAGARSRDGLRGGLGCGAFGTAPPDAAVAQLLFERCAWTGIILGALVGLLRAVAAVEPPRRVSSGLLWRAAVDSFFAGAREGCRLPGRRRCRGSGRYEELGDGSLHDG